jgi:glyoxylase-like metal-dependent hydrolase (beta-lactamase superfamily II)
MTHPTSAKENTGPIYPIAEPPPTGEPMHVAPGVEWLRVPLPFALDHINLWIVEDGDSWTLVDSGLASDTIKTVWRGLFSNQFKSAPPSRLMLTHFHPDHVGLAGWLEAEYGVGLWTSAASFTTTQLAWLDHGAERKAASLDYFTAHGTEPELARGMLEIFDHFPNDVSRPPLSFTRIEDGDTVRVGDHDWTAMICLGHAPGHLCFHCPELGVLIAGDQVLPRITTNISVWEMEPEADPLAAYLASLGEIAKLPEDTLVLPAHGLPFRGLRQRITALIGHHDDRLEEIRLACAEARTAASLVPELFRPGLDAFQTALALGETVAHLNHLRNLDQVSRTTGADGKLRFQDISSS